jgi:hypothetical protein
VIDTEAGRSQHYAKKFKFKYCALSAPFSPSDYMAAIDYCYKSGARNIIVDSMSHEHEGEGGVLEMHEAELQRIGGNNKDSFRAWAKPKSEHQRLKNSVLQMKANFIFCFRAKEKIKPDAKEKSGLRELGWQPIGDVEWMYEMTTCFLLPPMADGVPELRPVEIDSRKLLKVPEQFRPMFMDPSGASLGKPLSEAHGEMMKRWANGATTEEAIAQTKEAYAKKAHGTTNAAPAPPQTQQPREPGSDG